MTLRILLDQNIPSQVCGFVREHKPLWEVRHVSDVGLRGATDDSIFRWAQHDGWIIVTFDEDFADARMYQSAKGEVATARLRTVARTCVIERRNPRESLCDS